MALRWTSPFSASRTQVASYLLGVALFSISFLVFLNSSLSLVIRDLLGQRDGWGDAVGTLGFADELVALAACPLWGLVSDRLGTRTVSAIGYSIIGLSLFILVQAKNVYPDLLLARLLFSLGGAAATTMVTAILPTLTAEPRTPRIHVVAPTADDHVRPESSHWTTSSNSTAETAATVTPSNYHQPAQAYKDSHDQAARSISHIAGIVGMFTGSGALLALSVFLPLPAWLQKAGQSEPVAVKHSFYIVGSVAFLVAIGCYLGLRRLPGEESRGWRTLFGSITKTSEESTHVEEAVQSYTSLVAKSVKLALTDTSIFLGCAGGFVARASSVAVSTFIPLFINGYFASSGLCKHDTARDPSEIKEQCRRAYILASALTGAAELVALLSAPVFGWADSRYARWNGPLLTAAIAGVVGYSIMGTITNPDPSAGGGMIIPVMGLIGISQIGTIVCSLSVLGRGINQQDHRAITHEAGDTEAPEESRPLLDEQRAPESRYSRHQLKGTIAGLYSFAGGAGILLLTKLGGYLYDTLSPGAPFFMMAIFNGVLVLVAVGCSAAANANR